MSPSVASITVAYNAAHLLPRQLDALLGQTCPLQEIIVVDNASTDGTGVMLAARYPQVTVLQLPENLGQAGGWSAGLSYAGLEKRCDWIWTFDNDTVPAPEALEALFTGIEVIAKTDSSVGMVASVPAHAETGTGYLPFFWRDGFVKPSVEQRRQPLWFADMVIASGCLIRRDVVEKVGLPRADFFIDLCDFEYCLRIRAHGYKIAIINGITLDHEMGKARTVRLLGSQRLWPSQPPFREYYFSRNLAYLGWQLYPNIATKCYVARFLAAHGFQVMLFSDEKVACLLRMMQGIHDGVRGRLGIRLRPETDRLKRAGLSAGEFVKEGRA